MSNQLSTKSISQLCSTTEINDTDLFFISKYDKQHESGQQDWRSYKIDFDSIKRDLDTRYMSINEDFLTSDALVDLSDKWELAYSNTEILCADLRKISGNLSADIKYLSSQIDNSSLSINNLCLEIENIDRNLTSYIPKDDIVQILGNSQTKVPSQNLLSSKLNEISSKFNNYIKKIDGNGGEVFYISSYWNYETSKFEKKYVIQPLLEADNCSDKETKIYVCLYSNEVDKCMQEIKPQETYLYFIVYIAENEVYEYDKINKKWILTAMRFIEILDVGKFYYNSITGKMFYNNKEWLNNIVGSLGHKDIWTGTLAEYNALTNKNSNTIYYCKE